MSEFQLLVTPAQQTVVSPQLAAGSTIFNTSSQDAVWISGTPNPGPGNGYKVGGYGSIQWQSTGAAYAAVDAGVSSPVSLTVSDHVGNPVNPVDVGAAVAKAVNSQGIPNVLLGKVVYNGLPIVSGLLPGGGYVYSIPGVDFSQYASVVVVLTNSGPYQVRCDFGDPATGVQFIGKSLHNQRGTGYVTTFSANVTGGAMGLFISYPYITNITIYASNRQVVSEGLMGCDLSYIGLIPSQAWAVSQAVQFPGYFNSKGGIYTVRLSTVQPTTVCKGYFGYNYQAWDGSSNTAQLLDTATAITGVTGGTELRAQVNLPPGNLSLQWLNDPGATHTYDIKLTLTAGVL